MKNLKTIVFSFLSGLLGAWTLLQFSESSELPPLAQTETYAHHVRDLDYHNPVPRSNPMNSFADASEQAINSVVFIQTFIGREPETKRMFEFFFGETPPPKSGVGSGVILRSDGYILTNRHIVHEADTIKVLYNEETYEAEVIGMDADTDMAVLKINASNLPAIKQGRSRDLRPGDWILAVGNPLGLMSTVTAGIVSAVEREIDIFEGEFPLKSFIQTDAPINRGNSGGALVNAEGELVGIATAIIAGRGGAGSITGLGFAVPGDVAIRVANDLIEYGEVQEAVAGAEVEKITPEVAKKLNLKSSKGVIVTNVEQNGAAEKAGLRKNDIIYQIDGSDVTDQTSFNRLFSYHRVGDHVKVEFQREQIGQSTSLVLEQKTVNPTTFSHYLSEQLKSDKTLGEKSVSMLWNK